jgi:hypothetical protein
MSSLNDRAREREWDEQDMARWPLSLHQAVIKVWLSWALAAMIYSILKAIVGRSHA